MVIDTTHRPHHTPCLLEAQHVTFGYSAQALLRDVSLSAEAGEMLALLGPNGSGKTTLLRLLSGVMHPRSGQILLDGRDLRSWGRRGVARRVAVVPQELHMPFSFTVEHMVSMGRAPFQSSFFGSPSREDQTIVRTALEETGILPLADRVFNELSGGEQQRVMLAMALAQQPSVLLLDEPTSHLDIKFQIETLELVRQLNQRRSMTVIAAIHDLNLAARYFPRLVLFQGRVVADAAPAEVLEPGLLRQVYDVDVQVGILRGSTHLSVLPPPDQAADTPHTTHESPHIHVMAGGGSGEVLMRALSDEHFAFSAGAFNIGDSDHTLALRLASDVITEQPYAPLTPATLERVRQRLGNVSVLILCPLPIAPGNLSLLQEAAIAARQGTSVLLLTTSTEHTSTADNTVAAWATSDYTGGQATQAIADLISAGAIPLLSVQEVLTWLRQHAANQPAMNFVAG